MSAENEVKKCPFCGGEARLGITKFYATCSNTSKCFVSEIWFTVETWNRRSTVSIETAQKLADALKNMSAGMVYENCACEDCMEVRQAIALFNAEKGGQG